LNRKNNRANEVNLELARNVLQESVPKEKAFYFFRDVGQYTGKSALDLEEFYEMMDKVPLQCLEFHFLRGDFERWIREVIGDEHLASQIHSINKSLKNKKLKAMLKRKVRRRINQLKKMLKE